MPKKKNSKSKKTRRSTRKQKLIVKSRSSSSSSYAEDDVCTTYKQALELFLTTPSDSKIYTFPEEAEEFMKTSIETINKLMPPKNKIKISKFKQLVRELYRHPTIKNGGGTPLRITRGKKTKSKRQDDDEDDVNDDEVFTMESQLKVNVMDSQMILSIVALLISIYLASLVYERYTELDNALGLSGQGNLILESFKTALEENRRDNNLTFFMFLTKYFQSVGRNIWEEEGRIVIDLLKKTGETTTKNMIDNLKEHCLNPEAVSDWVTSYINPSGVTECISRVTENTTYKVLAEQGMIIAGIEKKKNDLVALARISHTLGSAAVMSLFHKIGYVLNPPVLVTNMNRRSLRQLLK